MPINTREIAAIPDSGGRVAEGRHVVTCTKGVSRTATNTKGDIWELDIPDRHRRQRQGQAALVRRRDGPQQEGVEAFFPTYQSQENVGAADLIAKRAAIDVVHREFQSDRDGKTRTWSRKWSSVTTR